VQRRDALGERRRDELEGLQLVDPLVDLLLRRLGGLPLLAKRLRLFLEDPAQPRRG
jgi:hypothetical protein